LRIPALKHLIDAAPTRRVIKEMNMRTNMASGRFKAIDLFAGPGGLSLGLTAAGFQVIAAVEYDKDAGKTYEHNIGAHTKIEDITNYPPYKLERELIKSGLWADGDDLDLIAGGPPCPGFSLIGRSKMYGTAKLENKKLKKEVHRFIAHPKNKLFREFVNYVKHFTPKYFVMENVQGMTSYELDDEPIVNVIRRSFGENYNVETEVLDASEFGVPQQRKRIIFIGTRDDMEIAEYPYSAQVTKVSALEAIRDLWNIEPSTNGEVTVATSSNPRGTKFRKRMAEWACTRKDGEKAVGTEKKYNHWTRKTNERDGVLFPLLRSGSPSYSSKHITIPSSKPRTIYGDIYPSLWESKLKPMFEARGMKVSMRKERHYVQSNDTKWVMYPNASFKDKMRRIRWDKPAPTIVAHLAKDGYMFVHPVHQRTITVREAARFQSFPDSFVFQGSMTSQFRQVGNAVPPLLAEKLGECIIKALKQSVKKSE
jgi:DNA (cytosine-5)-methyltransferase 1